MMYFAYTCYDVTLISTQCHKDVNAEKMDRLEKCHLSRSLPLDGTHPVDTGH